MEPTARSEVNASRSRRAVWCENMEWRSLAGGDYRRNATEWGFLGGNRRATLGRKLLVRALASRPGAGNKRESHFMRSRCTTRASGEAGCRRGARRFDDPARADAALSRTPPRSAEVKGLSCHEKALIRPARGDSRPTAEGSGTRSRRLPRLAACGAGAGRAPGGRRASKRPYRTTRAARAPNAPNATSATPTRRARRQRPRRPRVVVDPGRVKPGTARATTERLG